MEQSDESHPDRQLQFLRELVAEHAWIDGIPFEIDEHSWAIHGVIPYGGEVPMAVFSTYEEAVEALEGATDYGSSESIEGEFTLGSAPDWIKFRARQPQDRTSWEKRLSYAADATCPGANASRE